MRGSTASWESRNSHTPGEVGLPLFSPADTFKAHRRPTGGRRVLRVSSPSQTSTNCLSPWRGGAIGWFEGFSPVIAPSCSESPEIPTSRVRAI
jgi:hypothetical protein